MAFTFEEFPNGDYYRSDLREILKYMKEFEEKLDHFGEVIATFENAIKDIDSMKNAILALQVATSDLDEIRRVLKNNTTDIDIIFRNLQTVDNKLTTLSSRINDLKLYVDTENYNLRLEIQFHVIQLQEQIDELRRALMEIDTSFINPWHQELGRVNLQDNVKMFYADLSDNIPTAEEYAGLGLTAAQYAAFELPAIEYCLRGRKHLHMDWVFSPVYGWRQEISNVLTSIVNDIKDSLTATEYAALDMTADEYAALDLTALDYFSFGQTNVYVTAGQVQTMIANALVGTIFNDNTNTGLTATEYSQLGVRV